MTIEIAVINCKRCGRMLYVYPGPDGKEAMCIDCGEIFFPHERDIRWGNPLFAIPKGAITREVP